MVEEERGCFVRILRSTLHFKQIFCISKWGLSILYLPGGGGGDCFGVGKMGVGHLILKLPYTGHSFKRWNQQKCERGCTIVILDTTTQYLPPQRYSTSVEPPFWDFLECRVEVIIIKTRFACLSVCLSVSLLYVSEPAIQLRYLIRLWQCHTDTALRWEILHSKGF